MIIGDVYRLLRFALARCHKDKQQKFSDDWARCYHAGNLTPEYYKVMYPVRTGNRLWWDSTSTYILKQQEKVLRDIFRESIIPEDTVAEFGAGTCRNLVALEGMYHDINTPIALDYTPATQAIANAYGFRWHYCDLTKNIPKVDANIYLTHGALEQVGTKWQLWLTYCMDTKPDLVINFEPLVELLNLQNPLDLLSYAYTVKRDWLRGYLTALWSLQREGKIEIVKQEDHKFGLWWYAPNQVVIWRPKHD